MTPFGPLELPGRKADRIPVVLVVLVLGVVLVSCGVAIQKSLRLSGMPLISAGPGLLLGAIGTAEHQK